MEKKNSNQHMYDIIGDIHGFAIPLKNLLHKLGYQFIRNVYTHPEGRQVIFVGDFIDRGPNIRETLQIVKEMCDAGTALAVMGNHEYNAICFHTPHTGRPGFFRVHSPAKEHQHIQTLKAFASRQAEWETYLNWFKTLPLFLEMPGLNVVHAYWEQNHIDWIKKNYHVMDADFLTQSCDPEQSAWQVVEDTLKGIETLLPQGLTTPDKEGTARAECRIKWWLPLAKRMHHRELLIACPTEIEHLPLPHKFEHAQYPHHKPVFFGHYSLRGNFLIENEMAVCLDYNVTRGGGLIACRITESEEGILKEIVFSD